MTETEKPCHDFWQSADANQYEEFSTTIPSDIPAYEVVYHLLDPAKKQVLDFGCYHGQSSKNLLDRGALQVTGVDNVGENIRAARQGFGSVPRMEFLEVPTDSPLPPDRVFDAASMTFVHPTINNRANLVTTFTKISGALKPGGNLVLLGLHPNSFSEKYHFRYYGHRLEGTAIDGAPFDNELKLPDGQTLRFTDYFWRTNTLLSILEETGFSLRRVFDLRADLSDSAGDTLRTSIARVAATAEDEWQAPLYQIIQAKK